jgi:catechol 2,3-dioxygenase-like lactoylglutathione lyase family enzyme
MIVGAHSIVYSRNPEADRAFLRDALGMPHVDAGEGWLIFGLPPAEVAVHPSDENDVHEFYLMCDDVDAFVAQMKARGVECGAVQSMGWGRLTQIKLPGGGKLGVYQPRHARPKPMRAGRRASRSQGRAGKRVAAKPRARKAAAKKKSARRF